MNVELDAFPPYAVIDTAAEIPVALSALGLPRRPRPVLVCVGGAGGLGVSDVGALLPTLLDRVVGVLEQVGAAAVDGGTDAGLMRALATARSQRGARIPLLGVAAVGTIRLPGQTAATQGAADAEARHTAVLAVPGEHWGDESGWMSLVATHLAGGSSSLTLVINGGAVTYGDVEQSLEDGRSVLVVAGSGRAADAIARAAAGFGEVDQRSAAIASSPLVQVVGIDHPDTVAAAIARTLRV